MLAVSERSKGRYSDDDLAKAYETIGCKHGYLLTDDHLWDSFTTSYTDTSDSGKKRTIKEAVQLISENRNSDTLRALLVSMEEEVKVPMDFKKALSTLELPAGVNPDEFQLEMVFNIRVMFRVLLLSFLC